MCNFVIAINKMFWAMFLVLLDHFNDTASSFQKLPRSQEETVQRYERNIPLAKRFSSSITTPLDS